MKRERLSDADLVIFGCGYLGSALAESSAHLGLRVHAVTRNPETARRLRRLGITVFEGLLEDDAWHSAVPPAPAYVVNCVGALDRTIEGYRRSYIDGINSIARWSVQGMPGVLVYTSSTGVYGKASGDVDEDTEPGVLSDKNQILRAAELTVAGGLLANRWFVLRLSGLYGPGRHRLLDQVRSGHSKFDGKFDRRLNIIHRLDACEAILDCLAAGPEIDSQIFNVTSDVAANRSEMIRWLTKRFHRDEQATGGIELAAPGVERNVPDRVVSNRRIREVLGWRPLYPDFRAGYRVILKP